MGSGQLDAGPAKVDACGLGFDPRDVGDGEVGGRDAELGDRLVGLIIVIREDEFEG